MGCFSWMFADTYNQENLCNGRRAYLALPDGSHLKQYPYEGYGEFGGKDVYELVVDWNLMDIDTEKPKPLSHPDARVEYWFDWEKQLISALKQGGDALANEVAAKLRADGTLPLYAAHDWKRDIGISIACGTYRNAHLRYPIKVMKRADSKYDDWPASDHDPDQGCIRARRPRRR